MGSKVVVAEDVVVGGGVAVDMAVVKVMVSGTCDDRVFDLSNVGECG